ncbi:hypothetical protein KC19_10G009900 [Ceratodon purpureus]|uniref:Uncharacterized protein n=1 Tax=Ceratodon purpureus TaxID=3225 RepID=A0A8T0GFH2_CERPU|nr:hypothetical protein KC19_10G009900 [Ceratodon purpureus]
MSSILKLSSNAFLFIVPGTASTEPTIPATARTTKPGGRPRSEIMRFGLGAGQFRISFDLGKLEFHTLGHDTHGTELWLSTSFLQGLL